MNVKNTVHVSVLLITLIGLPLFSGLKKNTFRNKPLVIKKKRKKIEVIKEQEEPESPELFPSTLDFSFDSNVENNIETNNEKYKKIEEEQDLIQEIISLEKIDSNQIFEIEKKLEKINFSSDTEHCSRQEFLNFRAFVKNEMFANVLSGLNINPITFKKTGKLNAIDAFYCISWDSVENWVDEDNCERAKKCAVLALEHSRCVVCKNESHKELNNLIQGHYKIHIMPKNTEEGIRVAALLLYLLKNNAGFKKYAYACKFIKTFSLDEKDYLGQQLPVFVIYSVWGKKCSQNVLNIVALALKQIDFAGSSKVPRYNFRSSMNGLTWAMGDADFKPNEFFDNEKNYSVCSNAYFNNNKRYELVLSLR